MISGKCCMSLDEPISMPAIALSYIAAFSFIKRFGILWGLDSILFITNRSWPLLSFHFFFFCLLLVFYYLSVCVWLFFRAVWDPQQNWAESTAISHIPPASTHTAFPIVNIPRHSGTFAITDDPTWTRHYHPKTILYNWVHSWCSVHGFGQMSNDMYLSYSGHRIISLP